MSGEDSTGRSKSRLLELYSIIIGSLLGAFIFALYIWSLTEAGFWSDKSIRDPAQALMPSFIGACFLYVASAWFFGMQEKIRREEERESQAKRTAALVRDEIVQERGLVAEELANKVAERTQARVDDVLLDRGGVAEVIASVKSRVWISQEVGDRLFEKYSASLREFVSRGGSIRLILIDYSSAAFSHAVIRARSVQTLMSLKSRHDQTLSLLKEWTAGILGSEQRVEVRYSRASLPISLIIANPRDTADTIVACRIEGSGRESSKQISFVARKSLERRFIDSAEEDFEFYFGLASKVVFIRSADLVLSLIATSFSELHRSIGVSDSPRAPIDREGLTAKQATYVFPVWISQTADEVIAHYLDDKGHPASLLLYKSFVTNTFRPSKDGIRELVSAIRKAVSSGCSILIGGLEAACLNSQNTLEYASFETKDTSDSPENLEFYKHYTGNNNKGSLTLEPIIHELLNDPSCHLFIHLNEPVRSEAVRTFREIQRSLRTTLTTDTNTKQDYDLIRGELTGSAKTAESRVDAKANGSL